MSLTWASCAAEIVTRSQVSILASTSIHPPSETVPSVRRRCPDPVGALYLPSVPLGSGITRGLRSWAASFARLHRSICLTSTSSHPHRHWLLRTIESSPISATSSLVERRATRSPPPTLTLHRFLPPFFFHCTHAHAGGKSKPLLARVRPAVQAEICGPAVDLPLLLENDRR